MDGAKICKFCVFIGFFRDIKGEGLPFSSQGAILDTEPTRQRALYFLKGCCIMNYIERENLSWEEVAICSEYTGI